MSTALSLEFIDDANAMLAEDGIVVTFIRKNQANVSPLLGKTGNLQPVSLTTLGIVGKYNERLIDGTAIRDGDKLITITNTLTPQIGDAVHVAGDSIPYTVVNFEPIAPQGIVVIFRVQVR